MKAQTRKILALIFLGADGKLSFTALFAAFSFVVMVTLYIKGLLQGYEISAHWLDWSILIIEVAVLGRVGQKVMMEGVSAIATIRKPKPAPGIEAATPQAKRSVQRSKSEKPAPVKEAPKAPLKTTTTARVNGDLTPNFSWAEFDSHDGAEMPLQAKRNIKVLAKRLEVIREAAGNKTITITSGYRSPAHNKAVGGEPKSKHMLGMAADIKIQDLKPSAVADLIEQLIADKKLADGGLGRYPNFTHYDISTPRRWKK